MLPSLAKMANERRTLDKKPFFTRLFSFFKSNKKIKKRRANEIGTKFGGGGKI